MKAMTYEELMSVDGGRLSYSGFTGRGVHAKHRSWWSRHRKTVISHAKAAGKGFGYARATVFIGRLVAALVSN